MAAKNLSKSMKEFISGDWGKMEVYMLSEKQAKELMESRDVFREKGIFPPSIEVGEHSHSLPQLLLAEKGFLTHYASGKAFPQKPGELLVVPANVPHTAKAGGEEELVFWVFNKVPKKN